MKCFFRFLLPFLIFYTLTGCVANKRGMVNEHLYTSNGYPDLQIEVDSTFQYTKGGPKQYDHIFIGPYKKRNLFFEHQYMHVIANTVDYYNHPSHWIYFGIPSSNVINDGETLLLGETWFFANTFNKMGRGCRVSKYLRRFTNDQHLFLIKYMMLQSDTDCSTWEHSLSLNSAKENALKKLDLSFQDVASINKYSLENKNATNNISVVKSQESTENLHLTAKQKMLDAGINPLTNEQLKVLFSKPTDVSYSCNKGDLSIKHSPDGTQQVTYDNGGSDEGFWRIANGEICGKWKNLRQGTEHCSTIFQVEENKYKLVNKSGSVLGTLMFN